MERYYKWLTRNVRHYGEMEYLFVLRRMFDKEFYSSIKKDENRVADGLYLRYIYSKKHHRDLEKLNLEMGNCRVLEAIIALLERGIMLISYEKTGIDFNKFFYIVMKNIGFDLIQFSDLCIGDMRDPLIEIDWILNRFLDRNYDKTGQNGGAFPIFHTKKNLRKSELWAQMNDFIVKNDYF